VRRVLLPDPSSLDIVLVLAHEWRAVYAVQYRELAAFAEQLQADGFVHVPMDAASKATEWTLSRQN
jgi:hypothetical protein